MSILHLPVLLVRGFTAETHACQDFLEHRRACEDAKARRAEEEAKLALPEAYDKACGYYQTGGSQGD